MELELTRSDMPKLITTVTKLTKKHEKHHKLIKKVASLGYQNTKRSLASLGHLGHYSNPIYSIPTLLHSDLIFSYHMVQEKNDFFKGQL